MPADLNATTPFKIPQLSGLEQIPSPALLFLEDRIDQNIQQMLELVGNQATRLRPHVKTHKTPEIIQKQVLAGISKFKAATLSEAELCASNGASDVLLAYPLQGPSIVALRKLQDTFPKTRFSFLVDSKETLPLIRASARESLSRNQLGVFLEIDCGMGRTGITPGPEAESLYAELSTLQNFELRGIHAYDGHLHEPNWNARHEAFEVAFKPVLELRQRLQEAGLPVPSLIAGGSPTFGMHAAHGDRECSPGTTVLWDFGYGDRFPELPFQCAAWLLTRVVSKPCKNRICLDLGHKAVAPEMPHPRVRIQGLEDAPVLMQSEEHLVLEVEHPERFPLGTPLLALPRHICPTVSMYDQAIPFRDQRPSQPWRVAARGRQYHANSRP